MSATTITTTFNDQGTSAPGVSSADTAARAELLQKMEGSLELLSGERVQVRPIRPGDAARLQAFHSQLSADSVVFRFFRYLPLLPDADAARFTHVDYVDRMALVATDGQGEEERERLLAVVRYDRLSADTAEVAFVVADHWQGHGIATALLHRLAAYARLQGITHLLAVTLATNAKMLEVLRHAGYPLSARYVSGEVEITLDISAPVPGEPAL
ncbi:MAG TPA: GNAT family N-acetyltransferase [Ktedonobacterales bacterium]|nr:GNAT family N-acetyltransferase [Ktedonobacterales bacterium]